MLNVAATVCAPCFQMLGQARFVNRSSQCSCLWLAQVPEGSSSSVPACSFSHRIISGCALHSVLLDAPVIGNATSPLLRQSSLPEVALTALASGLLR